MQFMLAPYPDGADPFLAGKAELGAMVLNNSWGCPNVEGCDPNTLRDAAISLRQAGIFVIASAGNDGAGCGTVKDPLAIYPEALSVGAIDASGELAYFSSLGPVTVDGSERSKPDLVAPGVSILSAFPTDAYEYEDGTSMAGPHVVGVVALMWSANPKLIGDIELTEKILKETAQSYYGSLPDCPGAGATPSTAVGYGIVDAYQAVKRALTLP
jgi:subtilisin family serine protease